jgi:hypothetical protein
MDKPERESGIPVVFSYDERDLMPIEIKSDGRTKRQG